MSFKCGIVGLPNVGKSTLFNALTNSSKAQAANFPFCTIDPNVGVVPVPDERLDNLSKVSKSKKIINTTISIDLLQPNTNTDAVIFTKISESDAIFLSDLGKKDKGFFESFIDDEINCFLKTEAFLTIFDNRLFSNRKKNLNTANSSLNKNTHSIHQNIIAMKKLSTNRISRKHKHMIYQYMNNNNYMNEDNKELKQMIEVVEKELMVYLTKQIQSFFNISKVCISTISIGDFLIDCSNQ